MLPLCTTAIMLCSSLPSMSMPLLFSGTDVTITHDDVVLSGTLTLPGVLPPSGKCPAVVLVSGSGAQDRDETIMGHKPFAVLAARLAEYGIASLRYDDRGAGGSSALNGSETTIDFAADARAAMDFLATQPQIDTTHIGYVGHSEGATIALMNAARTDSKAHFIVGLGTPAVKGKELMVEQNRLMMETYGMSFDESTASLVNTIFTYIEQSTDAASLEAQLIELFAGNTVLLQQVPVMCSPWYVQFVKHDPSRDMARVKCPVLSLHGEWDAQVGCAQNSEAVKRLMPNATVKTYPKLNHMMQTCTTRAESINYGQIKETIAPQVIDDIAAFILSIK